MPRPASISQTVVNVSFSPLPQVLDLRVDNTIRKLAHILLQLSIHQLEAGDQKVRVMVGRGDKEPLIDAPGRIDDEVGKGFVKGLNGAINILVENEERVNR